MFVGLATGKRIAVIAGILVVAFAISFGLAACSGSGGNIPSGGNNGASGNGNAAVPTTAPSATPSGNDDPCPCCPDCIQKECECAECGENDDYDCECKLPGGGGAFTFLVETKVTTKADATMIVYNTFGEATVTLDQFEESGFYGVGEGIGRYSDWFGGFNGDAVLLEAETGYEFTVKLLNFDPRKSDSITVGINRFSADKERFESDGVIVEGVYTSLLFQMFRTDILDKETGLYMFELPMKDGVATQSWNYAETAPGNIDLTITVTMLD